MEDALSKHPDFAAEKSEVEIAVEIAGQFLSFYFEVSLRVELSAEIAPFPKYQPY